MIDALTITTIPARKSVIEWAALRRAAPMILIVNLLLAAGVIVGDWISPDQRHWLLYANLGLALLLIAGSVIKPLGWIRLPLLVPAAIAAGCAARLIGASTNLGLAVVGLSLLVMLCYVLAASIFSLSLQSIQRPLSIVALCVAVTGVIAGLLHADARLLLACNAMAAVCLLLLLFQSVRELLRNTANVDAKASAIAICLLQIGLIVNLVIFITGMASL